MHGLKFKSSTLAAKILFFLSEELTKHSSNTRKKLLTRQFVNIRTILWAKICARFKQLGTVFHKKICTDTTNLPINFQTHTNWILINDSYESFLIDYRNAHTIESGFAYWKIHVHHDAHYNEANEDCTLSMICCH